MKSYTTMLLLLLIGCSDPTAPPPSREADAQDDCVSVVDDAAITEPIHASEDVSVRRVFAGWGTTYATARDGTLWAWGNNGDGTMQPAVWLDPAADLRLRPQRILGVTDVRDLQWGGEQGTCVLAGPDAGGSVYCWGRTAFWVYGTGGGRDDSWPRWCHPRKMGTFEDVLSLAQSQACVRADHAYWVFDWMDTAWRRSTSPVQIAHAGQIRRSVTPGVDWVDGGVVWWLDGLVLPDPVFATGVQRIDGIVDISGGLDHMCILLNTGRVMCWGHNEYGQCGTFESGELCGDSTPCAHVPTEVPGLTDVVKISAGTVRTCVIRRDGTVWCWGSNDMLRDGLGFLGDGRPSDEQCVPDRIEFGVRRPDPSRAVRCRKHPVQVVGVSNAVDLSVGSGHTCVVVTDGRVLCWGAGSGGALGDGTTITRSTPVQVRWH